MDDFLKNLTDQQGTEQQAAAVQTFARLIAAYYTALCAAGVPDDDAVSLTLDFQSTHLYHTLEQGGA